MNYIYTQHTETHTDTHNLNTYLEPWFSLFSNNLRKQTETTINPLLWAIPLWPIQTWLQAELQNLDHVTARVKSRKWNWGHTPGPSGWSEWNASAFSFARSPWLMTQPSGFEKSNIFLFLSVSVYHNGLVCGKKTIPNWHFEQGLIYLFIYLLSLKKSFIEV